MTSDKSDSALLNNRHTPLLAALLFVAVLLPFAKGFVFFHPDETHYINGPIYMMQSGDLLTPRNGQGELRFNKPILTYWTVYTDYRILGVSALSTRLPFLLAGALTIWLTYQLAMLLFTNRSAALIASLIVASNPLAITAAIRANPDMLMTLFLLASVYGFFALILSKQQRSTDYYLAYLGIGLAVAVKGPFPVLPFAVISLLYARYNPWRPVSFGKLLHLPSMLPAFLVAVGWFVAMYVVHGAEGIGLFLDDHVSGRVGFQWGKLMGHMAAAAGISVLFFLPWNLILLHAGIKGAVRKSVQNSPQAKLFAVFALLWTMAIIAMSGPVAVFYPRYILPIVPLLAVSIAHVISQAETSLIQRWSRALVIIAVLLSLPFLGGGLLMALANSEAMASAVIIFLSLIGIAVVVITFKTGPSKSITAMFAVLLLLVPALYFFARPFALPDQGSQIADKLRQLELLEGKRIAYLGKVQPAAKIRVAAGPQLELHEVKKLTVEKLANYDAVVFKEDKRPKNGLLSGYKIELAARSWSSPPLKQLWAADSFDEAVRILRHPDQIHYVAWRSSAKGVH